MDLITYALCKKHGGESITYTLTADTENKTIVLTPSEGTAQVITVPYATDASTVNGHEVPELENGKIPANFLPSFVDNVDEYDNISLFPVVGESNRIYIDKSTNKTYRWSGTAYVEISESIALGETSSTAYRGDRGKIAYDHSQSAHAPSNAEANQNAFSNVKIDSDIINASAKTDTLEFIAGDNIILTPNVSNKKITVSQVPVRKTASGDIASFSDGTGDPFLEVKANINPVQDLHGYDYPWVGGAGVNKLPVSVYSTTQDGITYTATADGKIKISGTATADGSILVNLSDEVTIQNGQYLHMRNDATGASVVVDMRFKSGNRRTPTFTSINRIFDLSTSAGEVLNQFGITYPANETIDITFQPSIESNSTDTDYTPYSNICPISGWSGAKIADDAEYGGFINWNQLAQENTTSWAIFNVIATLNDDEFTVTSNTNAQAVVKSLEMRAINNHVYFCSAYLKTGDPDYAAIIGVRYRSGLMAGDSRTSNTDYTLCSCIGKADDDSYLSLRMQNAAPTGTSIYAKKAMFIDLTQMFGTTIADYIHSLEQATAGAGVAYFRNLFPHDYYPYNAGEITTVSAVNGDVDKYSITSIPFHDSSDNPVTVYGGTLNVTSGELRVDRTMATFNGSETWYLQSINSYGIANFYIDLDHYPVANFKSLCNMLLSQTSLIASTETEGYFVHQGGSSVFIRIFSSRASTVEEFKTWLASNPIQLVYALTTPQTYQLTPTQVSTLLGQNNIFADCGQVEVAYKTPFYTDLTTKNEVQVLINESITSALNASY